MNNNPKSLHIVVIAPHPDDELLGCGGMMINALARGHRVTTVFLTSGDRSCAQREREARSVQKFLHLEVPIFLRFARGGLTVSPKRIARLTKKLLILRPDLLFVCHERDGDTDHQQAYQLVNESLWRYRQDLRGSRQPITTLLYEVHRPMEQFAVVEDISSVMARKIKALGLYHSQMHRSRLVQAIMGLNQYRGSLHDSLAFAEVFVIKRMAPWW